MKGRYDPLRHHRRSIRLKGYDYAQPGAYFITICVQDRVPVFGEIVGGVMCLSPAGTLVRATWQALPRHYRHLRLDAFVVMPNHVHGIVVLVDDDSGVGLAWAETASELAPDATGTGSGSVTAGAGLPAAPGSLNERKVKPAPTAAVTQVLPPCGAADIPAGTVGAGLNHHPTPAYRPAGKPAPSMTNPDPIPAPSMTDPDPVPAPSMTNPDPIPAPSMTDPGPIPTPTMTHPDPIPTPSMTDPGPIPAPTVALSNTQPSPTANNPDSSRVVAMPEGASGSVTAGAGLPAAPGSLNERQVKPAPTAAETQVLPPCGADDIPDRDRTPTSMALPIARMSLRPPSPTTQPRRHGLPEIVRAFKTYSARQVNQLRQTPGQRLWQRNYYEHVVRTQDELHRIRQYILDNPARWAEDRLHPNSHWSSEEHP